MLSIFDKHLQLLDEKKEFYEDNIGLLYENFNNPNAYHTLLRCGKYHRISTNSEYAIALLDGKRSEDKEIACKIINKVIDAQCKEKGKMFGLWAYFFEEPLEQMDEPDWNMADFNGIYLLQAVLDYENVLGEVLYKKTVKACLDACECTTFRNVSIVYTNVTIMDIYLNIVCGERFSEKYFNYGLKKLTDFYNHIMINQCYDEYNSPTYSVVAVNILSLMLKHIKNKDALSMINKLYDIQWKMIAEHYIPSIGEWAGPQYRAYTEFLDSNTIAVLKYATNQELKETDEIDLMTMRYGVKCPEKYIKNFFDNKEFFKSNVIRNLCTEPEFGIRILERFCIAPKFSLGTFSNIGTWNQHRFLLGYFGNKQEKYCLRARVLHDGYDFCSGFINTLQEQKGAFSIFSFCTDGGDTHVTLDMVKNKKILASDMRIRYQLKGNSNNVKIEKKESEVILEINDTIVKIGFSAAYFGNENPYFEINKDDENINIDMVLYSGPEKTVDFGNMERAVVLGYVLVGDEVSSLPDIEFSSQSIFYKWNIFKKNLKLCGLFEPTEYKNLALNSKQYIDGKEV